MLEAMVIYPERVVVVTPNWHSKRAGEIFTWAFSITGKKKTSWDISIVADRSSTSPVRVL